MKAGITAIWLLTVASAFGLGRWTGHESNSSSFETADAIETLRAGLESSDPLIRAGLLGTSLDAIGPAELPAAVKLFRTHRIGLTSEEARLLMLAWTRFDGPAAYAYAMSNPSGWGDILKDEVMFAWGYRDGRAALAATEEIEDSQLKKRLRYALQSGWVTSEDRQGATEYVATVPDGRRRGRLAFLLAAEVMRDGIDAVIAWADQVPDDAPSDFKETVFYVAAGAIAAKDPQRAASWFEAHSTEPYSARAPQEIARKWAHHDDPSGFFDWFRSLPEELWATSSSRSPVKQAFATWLNRNPESAEAWLRAALPDPMLDPAVGELVKELAQSAPPDAMELASLIDDAALRRSSTFRAGRLWFRSDPEALNVWLAQSDLPKSQKRAIRAGPPPVGTTPGVVMRVHNDAADTR